LNANDPSSCLSDLPKIIFIQLQELINVQLPCSTVDCCYSLNISSCTSATVEVWFLLKEYCHRDIYVISIFTVGLPIPFHVKFTVSAAFKNLHCIFFNILKHFFFRNVFSFVKKFPQKLFHSIHYGLRKPNMTHFCKQSLIALSLKFVIFVSTIPPFIATTFTLFAVIKEK
jgi:hypothetical protein